MSSKPKTPAYVESLFGGETSMARTVIDLAGPWYRDWTDWKEGCLMCLLPPAPKGEETTEGGIIVPAAKDMGTEAVVLTRTDEFDDIEYAPAIVSPGAVTDLGDGCGLVHWSSVLCQAAWKKMPHTRYI